jgi:glutamyl-tRNA reductase
MQRLLLLGLNHSTAPLAVREKIAFSSDQRLAALAALRQQFEGAEAVLLSTCNRVELYVSRPVHGHPRHEALAEFVATFRGVAVAGLRPHLYEKSEKDVVAHLFSVASSLDSMVIGETQILGQVRDAYDAARAIGAVGGEGGGLNPLFQRAIAVGKQVMAETKIAEGRLSVGSVAVDCAKRIFDRFNDKTVLCVGAGKMAALVLRGLAELKPRRLLVCNRDPSKAALLAQKFGGEAVGYNQLDEHLVAADIVVSSTGSAEPIITRQRFDGLRKQRRYRPIFLIDIAMPRDVEPGVGELENVYLYNLDDLQQVVAATHNRRGESVEPAQKIVAEQVERFVSWRRARELGPMIDRLYQRHHELAREELERTLNKFPNITSAERAHLEDLTRRIVNKLLHDPIRTLRESDSPHFQATPYLHALEKLFQLENDASDVREPRQPGELRQPDDPSRPAAPPEPPDEQAQA